MHTIQTMMLVAGVALAPVAAHAQAATVEERSIDQLRAAMAHGAASSEAITRAYLARIAAMDRTGPTLRAVIAINPDAIAEARAADARRQAGKSLGPLDGIPILVKDNIETSDPLPPPPRAASRSRKTSPIAMRRWLPDCARAAR